MSTPGGRPFLLTIAGYMNSNRYTTNPKGVPSAPDYGLLYNLLSGPSPINPNSNLTHEVLTRELSVAKGARQGYGVHVYENGVEVQGSPFNTYAAANVYLGLQPTGRTVYRYLDTNKLYRGKYSFRSSS